MYIPIAIYKNNAVLIDSMDTFALYFCSSVKQKMKPAVPDTDADFGADGMPVAEAEDEFGSSGITSDDPFADSAADDDDDL